MNTLRNFAKFVLLVFSRNLNISRKIYINGISRSGVLKCIICSDSDTHSRAIGGVISRKIAHKVAKSKYF